MKNPKITFISIDGTGSLHIDFQSGPFGDAVEANKGDGIGFFGASGELQGVTFDDVSEEHDHQVLEFERYQVEIKVNRGRITHSIRQLETQKKSSSKKNTENAA